MGSLGLRDIPLRSLDDEALGLSDYASSLSEFILQCETPLTIAIQGDWGSGKTSLMNLVKLGIEESDKEINKIQTIWFNTWQYSQFDLGDDLPILLLNHFVKEIGDDEKEPIKDIIFRFARKGLKIGLMAGGGKNMGAAFDEAIKTADELDAGSQLKELKEKLEKLVIKKNKDRIIVFIDDLDRLIPEKAVELLEVFKLFLDIPTCVYVLACDYQVVMQGLKAKFKIGTDELKGKSFFDKVIQLPFSMPIGLYETGKYVENMLNRIRVKFNKDDIALYVDLVRYSIGSNPRSMKRLFNSMLLLNLVADKRKLFEDTDLVAEKAEKQRILFAILCLQTNYEPVYNYIIRNIDVIDQSFFDNLQDETKRNDDKRFEDFRREIDLTKLSSFIKVLHETLQLKSDTDRNNLSESEFNNLKKLINFSSITSKETLVETATLDEDARYYNREIVKKISNEINNFYKKPLAQFDAEFAKYQGRGVSEACSFAWINNEYQLCFWIDKNIISIKLESSKQSARDDAIHFFDEKLDNDFPNRKYFPDDYHFAELLTLPMPEDFTWEQRGEYYKKMVFEYLDKILTKLQENI
jgi:hypothetical protein